MARPATKLRSTYQDVLNAPEHFTAEILAGELVLTPRPGVPYLVAESRLLGILTGPFVDAVDGPGGWVAVQEPEIHFATDGLEVVVPDVAAWHRDRLPQRPAKAFVEIAPDWVCEVLSPGTAKRDRTIKKDVYRREKVGHLWLIDPKDHVLEAYALVGDAWEVLGRWPIPTEPGSMFRIPPFDAVPLDLAKLWKW